MTAIDRAARKIRQNFGPHSTEAWIAGILRAELGETEPTHCTENCVEKGYQDINCPKHGKREAWAGECQRLREALRGLIDGCVYERGTTYLVSKASIEKAEKALGASPELS